MVKERTLSRNVSVILSLGRSPFRLMRMRPFLSKTAAARTTCCAFFADSFLALAV